MHFDNVRLIGLPGISVGILVFITSWSIVWVRVPKNKVPKFEFKEGAFETLLAIYIDVTKFILGLAAGGIVLIVGTLSLRENHLPIEPFASPLFLLAMSIMYGLLFMPLLVLNYESFKITKKHSRLQYIRNRVLAYSGLSCFCIGYAWLIVAAMNR